eukprot:TRINITY_DN43457_c0_g1_i1.p1 TRINITY_DN43457_c0_g1~~TRINITY_DN43457_c0_g1_i1.p1  ORF type:complete len:399 (-),score=70.42 TRINITY_DN43457_c0_g1_i1:76-1194(-)
MAVEHFSSNVSADPWDDLHHVSKTMSCADSDRSGFGSGIRQGFKNLVRINSSASDNWEVDSSSCAICAEKIGRLTRHHCRVCGRCVCAPCSPSSLVLAGSKRPQRACTPCVAGVETSFTLKFRLARLHSRFATLAGLDELAAQEPLSLEEAAALCEAVVGPIESTLNDAEAQTEKLQVVLDKTQTLAEKATADLEAERAARAEAEAQVTKNILALGEKMHAAQSSRWPTLAWKPKPTKYDGSPQDALYYCDLALESIKQALEKGKSNSSRAPSVDSRRGSVASDPAPEEESRVGRRPSWEGDSTSCSLCSARIGKRFFRRRHHCRRCGRCVCSACSPALMPVEGHRQPQRACIWCLGNSPQLQLERSRTSEV